jgi:squalene-hopene/tetraprenyl-beta-curcumene cyclase
MSLRLTAFLVLAVSPAFCGDWSPKLAEKYMDGRQEQWLGWPTAMASGVACVSCHTGLPYLMARPALRHALGENEPTLYEGMLKASMRATVSRTDAKDLFTGLKGAIVDQVYGAQAILNSLVLAMDDAPRGHLTPEGERSLARMWSIQVRSGKDKGGWQWSDFDLDPWETADSAYYGAALAALATGIAPGGYQSRAELRDNIAEMTAYLREGEKTTALHNRLFMLWASSKMPNLLPASDKRAILDEVWQKQQPDGGWALDSLGPWQKREQAPPSNGSNSYATALVAFTAQQAGVRPSDAHMSRALAWLRSHQDASGKWPAESMNHPHEAGSMPVLFMTDAATGYATLALLGNEQHSTH